MTTRVYLVAARMGDGPPEPNDLPAERVFIHASEPTELWVETESNAVPETGKAVCFALVKRMELGFERISGTVERKVAKGAVAGASELQ
jgi:hypothetical protein